MNAEHGHAGIDRLGLAFDRASAAKIRERPELVEVIKANLRRWMAVDGERVHPAHLEWQDALFFLKPHELADFIASDTPKANRLRQSTPVVGLLTEAERARLRAEHAA